MTDDGYKLPYRKNMLKFDYIEYLREINTVSLLLRFILAVLCGGAIGMEREQKQRPAGFRTHILVCVGTVTAMTVGIYLADSGYQTDVARIGAQVISGIGFLGTGTIIVTRQQHIKGLTTAAGLWACACIGLAIGAGFYEAALIGTVLIILVSAYLFKLGRAIFESSKFIRLYAEIDELADLGDFLGKLRTGGILVTSIETERSQKKGVTAVLAELECPQGIDHSAFLEIIRNYDCVLRAEEL